MLDDISDRPFFLNHQSQNLEADLLFYHCQQENLAQQYESENEEEIKISRTHLNKESTEESNSECIRISKPKKQKKKRIRKYISNNPNNKKGHWTNEQSLRYHCFLEINADFFIDSQRRKTDKIFKSMSNFIGTREPHQCRSHHQKIQNKFGSFSNILLNLRLENFKQTRRKFLISLIQKLGVENPHVYQDDDLKNQELLLSKLIEERERNSKCHQSQKIEQSDVSNELQIPKHNLNCACLMMSQNYEDQLEI